nr:TetR/AcrR family transcriptional regulator [Metabacillus kandeliae]
MSPRAGLDKGRILQEAAIMADQGGYDTVTLAAVAKSLSVQPPSLYNHISGLPELRKMLAIKGLEELYHCMANHTDNSVNEIAQSYLAFALNHPGLYEASLKAPDPFNEEVQEAGNKILNLIIKLLNGRGLEGDNVYHAVRGFRSLLHGFVMLEMVKGFNMNLKLPESLDFAVTAYIAGLEAKADEEP